MMRLNLCQQERAECSSITRISNSLSIKVAISTRKLHIIGVLFTMNLSELKKIVKNEN